MDGPAVAREHEQPTADTALDLNARMVDRAKANGAIRSAAVEAAFRAVLRHLFLPGVNVERVYSGAVVVTRTDEKGQGISSSSEVAIMAPMLEDLDVRPGHRVLELGAGTGYNAALLDHLVGAGGEVVSVELDPEIAAEAREHLASAGRERVRVIAGDGYAGHAERAPYDRIVATASVRDIPRAWLDQLAEGGRLTVPLRLRPNTPLVVTFERRGDALQSVAVVPGGFMPLRGEPPPSEPSIAIDDQWEAVLAEAADGDQAVLAALLRDAPTIEPLPEMPWQVAWLVGIHEPDWVTVRQRGAQFSWSGVYDRASRSLALMSFIGVPMRMGARVALVYGPPVARDRLRRLIEDVVGIDVHGLQVEAVPATRPAVAGEAAIAAENFRYAIRRT
jgi:protein-L-isoaspartate(D-aspartate) O-methyltransferase